MPGLVEEGDAHGDIAAFYDDVRATIRSTFVPAVFRSLALHPAYVLPAWAALRANLASTEAEASDMCSRRFRRSLARSSVEA